MTLRLVWCLLALLAGCGGGGSSSPDGGGPGVPPSYSLSGKAQKGPFAIGSQVSASELNANLSATGKIYKVQTTDNLGSFAFATQIGTRLVDISVNGYYLDEITGRLSTSVIDLQATVDLGVQSVPTVNVLTSLQAPRLKALMLQGGAFSAAYAQSQNEVLAAFGVDSARVNGLTSLDAMRIDGIKDADAVLLAVSATLAQMATDASKANGTSQAAELSTLVNSIAVQIGNSGSITSQTIVAARKLAQTEVNIPLVRSNLETYYAAQAVAMVAPKFEEWLDASGSGVLPQRQAAVAGLVFTDVAGMSPATVVTSNAVTIAGLGAGVSVAVAVDADTTIIKNNVALTSRRTVVQNGDTLAVRVTSPGYALTHSSTVSVGASSSTWRVSSRALGGTINGLTGSGLVLQLNSSETITLAAGSTSFLFASPVANAAPFNITLLTQPTAPAQICAVANGAGTVGATTAGAVIDCYAAGAAFIAKLSGDQQSVVQHQPLAVIPKILVTDRLNNPVSNAPVTFQASDGYYSTNPVSVATMADGTAQLYTPVGGSAGTPFDIYFHLAGAQYVTATVPGGGSVKFDVAVTPSTHRYDGKYICTVIGVGYFTISGGLPAYQGIPSYSTLDEGSGQLEITIGSNYKAHYYGQIAIDGAERGTMSGTYTASTFGGQSTDPIGNWSCFRL